jgi:hypothetical protein
VREHVLQGRRAGERLAAGRERLPGEQGDELAQGVGRADEGLQRQGRVEAGTATDDDRRVGLAGERGAGGRRHASDRALGIFVMQP